MDQCETVRTQRLKVSGIYFVVFMNSTEMEKGGVSCKEKYLVIQKT